MIDNPTVKLLLVAVLILLLLPLVTMLGMMAIGGTACCGIVRRTAAKFSRMD